MAMAAGVAAGVGPSGEPGSAPPMAPPAGSPKEARRLDVGLVEPRRLPTLRAPPPCASEADEPRLG